MQTLIDDYIVPLLGTDDPVFGGLIKALAIIGAIYLIGVLSSLLYSRSMVAIVQGTLKKFVTNCLKKCSGFPSAPLTPAPTAIL